MDEKILDILYKTYELKIIWRENHVDNFHKWMTFYSVAIGAILVAFCQYNENPFLSFLFIGFGLLTSFLFHLSCKGYKHWNDHWINEIWEFEEEIEKELSKINTSLNNQSLSKFKIFGRESIEKKVDCKSIFNPLISAKISTPKVTMAFSYCTFLGWLFLFEWQTYSSLVYFFNDGSIDKDGYNVILVLSLILSPLFISYLLYISSKFLNSRRERTLVRP